MVNLLTHLRKIKTVIQNVVHCLEIEALLHFGVGTKIKVQEGH